MSGPLLMVTPIGPRCFFATFVLTIWFIAEVCNLVNINEDIYGILTKMEITDPCNCYGNAVCSICTDL